MNRHLHAQRRAERREKETFRQIGDVAAMVLNRRLKRGDRVYDVADERHIGIIVSILHEQFESTCTVRWEETNWLSFRLLLTDMRLAPREQR